MCLHAAFSSIKKGRKIGVSGESSVFKSLILLPWVTIIRNDSDPLFKILVYLVLHDCIKCYATLHISMYPVQLI